jgi:hypothetical protein
MEIKRLQLMYEMLSFMIYHCKVSRFQKFYIVENQADFLTTRLKTDMTSKEDSEKQPKFNVD